MHATCNISYTIITQWRQNKKAGKITNSRTFERLSKIKLPQATFLLSFQQQSQMQRFSWQLLLHKPFQQKRKSNYIWNKKLLMFLQNKSKWIGKKLKVKFKTLDIHLTTTPPQEKSIYPCWPTHCCTSNGACYRGKNNVQIHNRSNAAINVSSDGTALLQGW